MSARYKVGDILVYVRNSDETTVTGIVQHVFVRGYDNTTTTGGADVFDNAQLRDETVAYTLYLSADESERIGHPVTLGESRVVAGAERLPADAWPPTGWPVVEGQPGGPVYRIFGDLLRVHSVEVGDLLGWVVLQWAFPGSDVLFREDPASRVVRKVQPWIYGNYASALAEVDRLRAEVDRLRALASDAREIITDECPRVADDWLAAAEKELA